jgi:GT2 family glycosyltransferase
MSEVAVVIPTYRRETRLRFALEALAAQTLDPARFAVIVVRAPGAQKPFAAAPAGLSVRFLTAPERGPGPQRNHGWRAATAPLIAFTDDDCRPAPGWLEALLAAADGRGMVQGRTVPDPDERHLLTGLARTIEVEGPSGWYESCNIAYPRELLQRLGGFDERFGLPPWGEDSDLGLRAREAGADLRYQPEALAWHAVVPCTLPRALAEARRREWLPLVIARHPQQRGALYRRLFTNRAHAAVAGGLLGLAVARRRGPATALAIAMLPSLAHNLDYNRGRGVGSAQGLARIAAQMPARLLIDLVELGSTVRGSVRHGALVI